MSLCPSKGHVLFMLLAFWPTSSLADSITQCFANVISCAENSTSPNCTSTLNISSSTAFSVLRSSDGSIIPPVFSQIEAATGFSYPGCVQYCRTDQRQFYWDTFSQEYSTWLLPYLSLLSQLPFGARRRMDNLMSVVLTVGSPVLASYSLYLTLLNARWVNDALFADIHYPNTAVRQSVVQVLSGLQQVPLRVHPGEDALFESLVVHPDNNEWWNIFAEELEYSHTWSIASATSILWVVIAYLLTVAHSIDNIAQDPSNGQETASGWLWLLPVVVGWLVLSPKCDYKRVLDAYNKANRRAFVANLYDPSGPSTHVTSSFGLTITLNPYWKQRPDIISPDEIRIPPIFNYARVWLWSQNAYMTSLFYRTAGEKSNRRIGVDDQPIPGSAHDDVPRESRLGNRDQIIRYCHPDNHEYSRSSVLWPPGMFRNMVVASLMALQLQWATTSAAILGLWFTPTVGLGCRSLVYLLYGALSTTVWILLVFSSILGYHAHHLLNTPPVPDVENIAKRPLFTPSPHSGSESEMTTMPAHAGDGPGLPAGENVSIINQVLPHGVTANANSVGPPIAAPNKHVDSARLRARTLAQLADWLRWIGKTIATINAIGCVANSLFELRWDVRQLFLQRERFYLGFTRV
ncbi:hypothetical protein JVU11DRAFT_10351 [Chiua virens]|nr:hypothetical protein JVU11DRAFT_10351 [Chiua virens]